MITRYALASDIHLTLTNIWLDFLHIPPSQTVQTPTHIKTTSLMTQPDHSLVASLAHSIAQIQHKILISHQPMILFLKKQLAYLSWLPQWQQMSIMLLLFLCLGYVAYYLCLKPTTEIAQDQAPQPTKQSDILPAQAHQEYNYFSTKESIHAKIHLAKAFFVIGKHNEAKHLCLEILSIANAQQRTEVLALIDSYKT